jgi:hypothetical protein
LTQGSLPPRGLCGEFPGTFRAPRYRLRWQATILGILDSLHSQGFSVRPVSVPRTAAIFGNSSARANSTDN